MDDFWRRRADWAFACVCAAFAIYSFIYILRLSFVVDGVRYFTLADDQMISMRYAEHLARGDGLVWNTGGPRIEGYTNFLWVLYMALFHWAGVARPWISACVQASGAAFLLVNLVFVRKLAEHLSGGSAAAGVIAAALTAFYVPLDNWAFQGTEVSLLTLAVTISVWLAETGTRTVSHVVLYLVLGAMTLVRPDTVVITVAVLGALTFAEPARLRRHLGVGVAITAAFVAAETVFRLAYFGDPLPNTYYLKITGIPLLMRTSRGLGVSIVFVASIIPFIGVLSRLRRHAAAGGRWVALAVFVAQLGYSAAAGGDAWERWGGANRFVSIAMPLLFALVAAVLVRAPWRISLPRVRLPRVVQLSAATLGLLIAGNSLALELSTEGDPLSRLSLATKPPEADADERHVRAALALRRVTDPSATVAVVWAGAIPYFSERPAIDLLGKMDRRIAHEPMHLPDAAHRWTGFVPGHLKWDYAYSIGELKPDIIQAPLWTVPWAVDNALPDLDAEYQLIPRESDDVIDWFARRNSPRVHFERQRLRPR